ncbi:MAG: pyridoxal-phosphate dependent enzyme [Bacteroidetes bacterium]|nr:pyridoxal-phosphate dependent enzyme [Bacteroidota bacterium]
MHPFFEPHFEAEIQAVTLSEIAHFGVEIHILREDLIHPQVSGNKFRKLKYNLLKAKKQHCDTLLTFGGAFSNHIAATAAAGQLCGFKTVGVIRGEELYAKIADNPTLAFAEKAGMSLLFVDRETYRNKHATDFQNEIIGKFENAYILPEGGTNDLAVLGCQEILSDACRNFDIIAVAVGTGGTISGIINSCNAHQKVMGFPALKGDFLSKDIRKFVGCKPKKWELVADYHFGGYAKTDVSLIRFINRFKAETEIPLDPIYTGKMMFGLVDMIKNRRIPEGSKILVVHTGGLQGIEGMNQKLKKRKQLLIN